MTTPGASSTSSAIIASSRPPRLRTATAEAARYAAGGGCGKAGPGGRGSRRTLRRAGRAAARARCARRHGRRRTGCGRAPSRRTPPDRAAGARSPPTIRRRDVPTSRAVPAAMPSGRSVVSRSTSTGLPSDGASSWMPPESVRTRWQRRSRSTSSAVRRAAAAGGCAGAPSSTRRTGACTSGFRWTGYASSTSGLRSASSRNAPAELEKRGAEALPAVCGDQDQAPRRVGRKPRSRRAGRPGAPPPTGARPPPDCR